VFRTLLNIFRIPELRNKLLFTIGLLCVYRIGFYIPLPGVDSGALNTYFQQQSSNNSALGQINNYLSLFSGGTLQYATVFGLGIMPYISSAIIFQLLGTVIPALEKLKKEGEPGMRKINEWTRYATVGLCAIQAVFWLWKLSAGSKDNPHGFLYPEIFYNHIAMFWVVGMFAMVAGGIFLMWLGEQIDQFGIGNGISLIIMAGIVSRIPNAINLLFSKTSLHVSTTEPYGIGTILFLVAAFVGVVSGAILLEMSQRRITIQQAKHIRGRHVYGGQSQYLPLRVNHGGVMPIIFASSLMLFPTLILSMLSNRWGQNRIFGIIDESFRQGQYLYVLVYIAMIYFFSYFWNTVQFQPKEMADQLRDYGSFIRGLRPGKRTAEYLENVMMRVTYCGAAFLSVIALVPTIVSYYMGVEYTITQFLGGTGLLIVVSVLVDFINRVEANLVMRNYDGLIGPPSGNAATRRPIIAPSDSSNSRYGNPSIKGSPV
jgi:preprotein translocase subunit SecY